MLGDRVVYEGTPPHTQHQGDRPRPRPRNSNGEVGLTKERKPDLSVIENSPSEEFRLAPDHISEPMLEEWLMVASGLRERKLLTDAMEAETEKAQ